jgi:hypothetical protein
LLNVFLKSETLNYIVGVVAIICIFISFKGAARLFQVMSAIFIAISLFIAVWVDINWLELPAYFTSIVLVLGLLYVLPFFNSMISYTFEAHL